MIEIILYNFEGQMNKEPEIQTNKTDTSNNNTLNSSIKEKKKDKKGEIYEDYIIKDVFNHLPNNYNIKNENDIIRTNKDIKDNNNFIKGYSDFYLYILSLSKDIKCKQNFHIVIL